MNKRIWDSVKSIGSTLVFVWVFTQGVAQATVVPSESMTPTILVGDHFFLDKVAFPANYPGAIQKYLPSRTIQRGEILAFWSPEEPNLRLVKRVIGLPGETLQVRHRDVYINDKKLVERYAIHTDPVEFQRRDDFGPITLGPDQFFMMGDNRDNSNDSRFWGPAPRSSFIGTPLFIYWSYDDVPYTHQLSATEWVEHSASVAAHFLTRTRWLRTGTVLH
ncbi:MAG TPA: signal peptidase I [Terriglobia bacterium]|jgi:signal peptidase I